MSHSYNGGDNIRFGFIGAGKVGFTLGKYLSQNNKKIVGYYSRNIVSSKEVANFTNSKCFETIESLINEIKSCNKKIFLCKRFKKVKSNNII